MSKCAALINLLNSQKCPHYQLAEVWPSLKLLYQVCIPQMSPFHWSTSQTRVEYLSPSPAVPLSVPQLEMLYSLKVQVSPRPIQSPLPTNPDQLSKIEIFQHSLSRTFILHLSIIVYSLQPGYQFLEDRNDALHSCMFFSMSSLLHKQ